jgi:predicted transcriptional regulator of viral defense system
VAGHENGKYGRLRAQALAQHAVIPIEQLVDLGMTAAAVQKSQWLYRRYRGVYTIVPPSMLSVKGRYLAAVLACGPAAALSHRSAADLHGLRRTDRARIDVIVPGRTARRHDGIDLHRSTTLTPADITIVDAIPVTTVARTVLDLAAVVRRRSVERALDQAQILEVFDLRALRDQLDRNPRHPGASRLNAILDSHTAGTTVTWSELEELCLEVTRAAGVERPEVNAWVDPGDGEPPVRADFVWRAQRVTVEADGFGSHKTRWAFENDRGRDQRLFRVGWLPVRVTDRQLREERERFTELLIDLLSTR